MICIYCKREITPEMKSVEHVFPNSFGCPDTCVLDCLCGECNNGFGGGIERWLASDSFESIIRLKTIGSQSGKSVKSRRMKLNLPQTDKLGEYQGARLERDFKSGKFTLANQVGLKNSSNNYEYFTENELMYSEIQKQIKNLSKQNIKILGSKVNAEIVQNRILQQLKSLDIDFQKQRDIDWTYVTEDNELLISLSGEIDRDIQRAIAKIAFNYLAKIRGADFVLRPEFNTIRNFINGVIYQPIVAPFTEKILLNDCPRKRYFVHIFIFERVKNNLQATISLFNQGIAYKVILSTEMGPFMYEIISGHVYNLHNKKFARLGYSNNKRNYRNRFKVLSCPMTTL